MTFPDAPQAGAAEGVPRSAALAALAACERVIQRLAGSHPDHRPEQWRIGAQLATHADSALGDLLPRDPKPAAVLIGLTEQRSDPGILLTVRAAHLRQHGGQVSFPGGQTDAGDTGPAATAMREAQEEVGLPSSQVQLVGYLPDQLVLTGFRITPVVGRITADFEPRFDPSEVQGSFVLPWTVLLDDASWQHSVRRIGGRDLPVREIHFGDYRVWGATAGILLALRELARE